MAPAITACPQCGLEYAGGEVFCPIDGARLSPRREGGNARHEHERDSLVGTTLSGRYRILKRIGEGGMGVVYEAEHVLIEKRVALKVLREDFSTRFDVVERFRQEAKSASKIGHEHIVDISDFGVTSSGANFFVMELLRGRDLAEELGRLGPLSPRRAVSIVLQCARALGAAHAKGIVHRDMKPENVFLVERGGEEDFVKIVDFGIAKISDLESTGQPERKLTKTGMIFGTPEYMSPEQAAGKPLDHRVDVYALGIILYELLTGRVPFMGDTFMGVLTQHMFEDVPPLKALNPRCNASPELERILFRAIAKDREERYQSMEELAADLSGALTRTPNSESSLAPPPGTITHYGPGDEPADAPRVGRVLVSAPATEFPVSRSRRSGAWPIAAALGVLAAAGGALFFSGRPPQPREARGEQDAAAAHPAPPPPASARAHTQPPVADAQEVATSQVLVEVHTQPAGAAVSVDGEPACSPTPCSISAARDAILKIEASLAGHRPIRTEVRADADKKQLELVLKKRAAPAARPDEATGRGELLIPDAFARPRRTR